MSNIYIQEPPALGKVLLKTSVGDIDLELWTKEAPKACRNFIQLCMEGYYNGTIFHRLVPEFIVQGGDPKGDGTGGESIYGAPFKDEFHSRLRFNRRGLVAMANAGKDDNSSQFFFTLNATPELQNKHTIFGKVTGETIFNMLKLAEGLTDSDDRPLYPHRIVSTEVLINTFTDIVPRIVQKKEKDDAGKKKKKERAGVKNYKLLSFGEEAEEDEDQTTEYRGKPKSTHDVLDDPKLSRLTGSDLENEDEPGSSNAVEKEVDEATRAAVSSIRDKLQAKNKKPLEVDKKTEENNEVKSDEEIEEYYLGKDRKEARKKEAEEIRRQISDLKREMSGKKKEAAQAEIEKEEEKKRTTNELKEEYELEQEKYRKKKEELPAKGASRHNQNEDENYQERKPWVKNLYENTGHYPDNYTDIKFLEQMRRNVNPHNVTFLESFLGSCRLSNKIASCVLFSVVFTYLYNEWITVHDVFTYSSGITMLGYLFFILARSVNTSRVETSTKKDAKKVNVKEKLNKKYCDESEDLNTEIMFETNMRNYLRRSANKKKDKNFSVKVIENKKDKSKNTSDSVSYLIFGDLKTVLIFLVFGYIVSPILHTLTDTVSTDTIFATCAIMMLIHLIFSDYGISAAIVSNSLSINAAIFGSICLSSRLSTSFHAFVLLTVAVECFVLQPILTSLLLNTPYSILIYTVNISSAFIFLWSVSKTIFYLFAFTIFLVNFYWPLLFIRWQKYKDNIYGPWDEAVVHDSDNIEECIGDT